MICLVTGSSYEASALLDMIDVISIEEYGIITIYVCGYRGQQFLVCTTGYSRLNLGVGFGILFGKYRVTQVIGFGDCGSLIRKKAGLDTIVIVKRAMEIDVDATSTSYDTKVVPSTETGICQSDKELLKQAKEACAVLSIPHYVGQMGSSEQFIANSGLAHRIRRDYPVQFVDNECGLASQAAMLNQIPSVFVKGVSNFADCEAAHDYRKYSEAVNRVVCKVVYQMLMQLIEPIHCKN